ncbi:MAG: helix-turn-helix domain-containing protein [Cognatishimia sp.]
MQNGFGGQLKEWRQLRRMSQMELALSAGVSSRHISFLETGRSRPSRGMVLRLCDELEMPRGARNQLLTAAGMAGAFESRALSEAEMAPLREAMGWMLAQHTPYPAIALDRHWHLVEMNAPAQMMFQAAGISVGDSMLDAFFDNAVLRGSIENLAEVERLSLARLRTELAHFGRDPVLEAAILRLQDAVALDGDADGVRPAVIPARYRVGDAVLSLFSTISQFGATDDIAMAELRIEMFFPADEATRQVFFAMAGQG